MVKTMVCHVVKRLEERRERSCAPGGPCLSPLGRVSKGGRKKKNKAGLPVEISRPERYNGEDLESS